MKQHILFAVTFWAAQLFSQNAPFQILLTPLTIEGLPGLQSYAFGQHDGKWLIIGGRVDGLHRRQPFAAFDPDGHNTMIYVVDPVMQQQWSAPNATLPTSIQEQLSSTNMQFHQDGDRLYLIGGYAYSATSGDHITFDKLTAVDVPGLVEAVINGTSITAYFRQITDPQFEVTGGRMAKIYDVYQLVGGQKFEGPYNPMGPGHGPGFVQEYTEQIRRFVINDDGVNLTITHLTPFTDTDQLHRRDYNVVPQIMPDGSEGMTAFSGVFQKTVDLPFLNCVNIDSAGYQAVQNFSQYYNHYHCPTIPVYTATDNQMHTLFFGGIAQFYDNAGVLVQDNNVPFVKTIARVTRFADGSMTEYKLPVEMPDWLGASAEFIPSFGLPAYINGVINYDQLADTVLLGHIFGGIASTQSNIFFVNDGTQSAAHDRIYQVRLTKSSSSETHQVNPESRSGLQFQVYPNPNNGAFGVKFILSESGPVWLTIRDANGAMIFRERIENTKQGENIVARKIDRIRAGNTYLATLETEKGSATVKMMAE